LPEADKNVARAALADVSVKLITLKTVREKMQYDQQRMVVATGRPFEILFVNEDAMPHNLVVVAPGAREEVAMAALRLPAEQRDAKGRLFVPQSDKILAATALVDPGHQERLQLTAPDQEGEYEYVCTFPNHWQNMWGTLIVTRDPAAWLASHP
jgi:azurin